MTRIVVTGGRTYRDEVRLRRELNGIHMLTPIQHLAQGGAEGADKLAREWAAAHKIPCKTYAADWSQGRQAGPQRNRWMLEAFLPDLVVAFPGGQGTHNCCKQAEAMGIVVRRIE